MQEMEPITKSTKGGLLMYFMGKSKTKCTNLETSKNLVKELDKCITEYREKTGEEIAGDIQATILHQAMDEETSKFMANTKDVDVMKYSDMKLYIETRYLEELGRRVINPEKKASPVSALEEGEHNQWQDYGYGNDLDALKGGKKGWGKGNKGEWFDRRRLTSSGALGKRFIPNDHV